MDKRPKLDTRISIKDFQEFYWLKQELVAFCRAEGLKTLGGKIEIAERIVHYLKTGKQQNFKQSTTYKPKSTFDWKNEKLTLQTKITDNYKNTENVRAFFEQQIGKDFKFNVKFMHWMKSNAGKTLEDSIHTWKNIKSNQKSRIKPKDIAPQFEYNTYLRDFLADNPKLGRDLGIKLWKLKRSIRGDNKYRKDDLRYIHQIQNIKIN